jgi:cation diffusion facilitator family transporter
LRHPSINGGWANVKGQDQLAIASRLVVYASLGGNVLEAVAKFGAASLSGSSSMLTEAVHTTANLANQVLLLIGDTRSRTKADASHPFGYGMEIYFWTSMVAILVLLTGGAFSIFQGFRSIMNPELIHMPMVSVGVLILSGLFELGSFVLGYRQYKKVAASHVIPGEPVGLWKFIKRSKDPNLYESLLEDCAALLGIAVALVGVGLNAYAHLLWADGAASLAIGGLLVLDAYFILWATRSLIAGESAALPFRLDIEKAVRGMPWSGQVADVATLHMGPAVVLVALRLHVSNLNESLDSAVLKDMEERVRAVDERIKEVVFRLG